MKFIGLSLSEINEKLNDTLAYKSLIETHITGLQNEIKLKEKALDLLTSFQLALEKYDEIDIKSQVRHDLVIENLNFKLLKYSYRLLEHKRYLHNCNIKLNHYYQLLKK